MKNTESIYLTKVFLSSTILYLNKKGGKMNNLIAFCGIDCEKCPAYIAFKTNDDKLREETAKQWSEMFKYNFKKEDINCEGCSKGKIHVYYCDSMCNIRKCAISKNIESCAFCSEYPCQMLSDFIKDIPEAKENLNKLRQK